MKSEPSRTTTAMSMGECFAEASIPRSPTDRREELLVVNVGLFKQRCDVLHHREIVRDCEVKRGWGHFSRQVLVSAEISDLQQ